MNDMLSASSDKHSASLLYNSRFTQVREVREFLNWSVNFEFDIKSGKNNGILIYSLPNKQYVKRQNKKSKEVDVIAHDIEASEKIEEYVNVLSCV